MARVGAEVESKALRPCNAWRETANTTESKALQPCYCPMQFFCSMPHHGSRAKRYRRRLIMMQNLVRHYQSVDDTRLDYIKKGNIGWPWQQGDTTYVYSYTLI